MKIIEALKEIKLIDSKLKKNNEMIERYSSVLDNERPSFESEAHQMQEVKKLVQSNTDLHVRYLKLKMAIEKTNMATKVKIEGQKNEYSIFELIIIKRKLGAITKQTYESMNTKVAEQRKRQLQLTAATPAPKVIALYDEKEKNTLLNEHEQLMCTIDGRLEVVNAVTDLIED